MCKIAYLATLPLTRGAARDAWDGVAPTLTYDESVHFQHLVRFARGDLKVEEGCLASDADWEAWMHEM